MTHVARVQLGRGFTHDLRFIEAIMKALTPAQLLIRLKAMLAEPRHELTWHYEIGELILRIVPESTYGGGEMQRLAKRLGRTDNFGVVLYQHRDFVRTFKRSELPKLRGLRFAHACVLMGVDDVELRERFRKQCVAGLRHGKKAWSVRLLRAKIQERIGKRSQGGRPMDEVAHVGPRTALRRFIQMRRIWQRQYFAPFEKNLQSLMKQLERNPTEELLSLAKDGLAALETMLRETQEMRLRLKKIRTRAEASRDTQPA